MEKDTFCIKCGKQARIIQNVYIDGATKTISYCVRCFVEMLKYESKNYVKVGVRAVASHMNFVEEAPVKDGVFEQSLEEIYSVMPTTIQLSIFRQESNSYKKIITDIKKRKLVLLNHRLRKAVKKENYHKASKIKKKMDDIKGTSE
ncbi:MAG: hypothetical protein N2Z58_04350 [Fervidobacterium sp.]|nr:hypothetical protein [Fervidobacterium sp.]